MEGKFIFQEMLDNILKKEANKIAKICSQIISIPEPNIENLCSDLADVQHERYVGNREEVLSIISNGKKLGVITEDSMEILSVNLQYPTDDRAKFTNEIYLQIIKKAQS